MAIFKNNIVLKSLVIRMFLLLNLVKCDAQSTGCIFEKTNTTGVCITIQNCQEAREELEKKKSTQICGFENGIPNVCCPKKFSQVTTSLAEEKCEKYSQTYYEITEKTILFAKRISGGTDAQRGEFPHMALLGYGHHPSVSWDCGGSLISEKFVLTAAHCITGKNVTRVQLGDVEVDSDFSKTYAVRKVHKYPDYNGAYGVRYHDVGLVELAETVEFLANIIPACLPKTTNIFPNLNVSGFGIKKMFGAQSEILQWTNVNYIPSNECVTAYHKGQIPNGILDEIQLCYGSDDGRDSCQGDSGGPLQYFDSNLFLHRVIGIVSIGKPCGSPKPTGIYTYVYFYKNWIESVVWEKEFQKALAVPKQSHSRLSSEKKEAVVRKRLAEEKCDGYTKDIEKLKKNSPRSKFPHMVAIGHWDEKNSSWHWSGTLISEIFVMTTAVCAYHQPTAVQLGENSLFNPSLNRKIIKIARIYTHPNFRRPYLYYDIALLELQLPVRFSPNIIPACLHTNDDNNSFLKFKTIVTGWGKTVANGNFLENLQEIDYQYLDSSNCISHYSRVLPKFLPYGINSSYQLCFVSLDKGKDACQGFAGAPLQFFDFPTKIHRVTGLVSFGNGCGVGTPQVFTKIAKFIDWIEETVWK